MFSCSATLSFPRSPEFRVDALFGAIAVTVLIAALLGLAANASLPWAFPDFGWVGRGRLLRLAFIVALALWVVAAGALSCLADCLMAAERKGGWR